MTRKRLSPLHDGTIDWDSPAVRDLLALPAIEPQALMAAVRSSLRHAPASAGALRASMMAESVPPTRGGLEAILSTMRGSPRIF